jgi:hypothetical protein
MINVLKAGDQLRVVAEDRFATPNDFDTAEVVIFVHGFTAHGGYLETFSQYFESMGYRSIIFEYNSYKGIFEAAESLFYRLDSINKNSNQVIENNRVTLVCHSMGGLVGRALLLVQGSAKYIKGMVSLGTPYEGTLKDAKYIAGFVEWAQYITGAMPGVTSKKFKSAKELIGKDKNQPNGGVLNALRNSSGQSAKIPILSISGGRNWLDVSKNPLINWLANKNIQACLKHVPNDGLVSEHSSNITLFLQGEEAAASRHHNRYPEYEELNHTYLIHNQGLALEIMNWIKSTTNSRQTTTVTTGHPQQGTPAK